MRTDMHFKQDFAEYSNLVYTKTKSQIMNDSTNILSKSVFYFQNNCG